MAYNGQRQFLQNNLLSSEFSIALIYHDLFGWPLNKVELLRWEAGKAQKLVSARPRVAVVGDYFVAKGHEGLVAKRLDQEQSSRKKMILLARAKEVLEQSPSILFVGITGSLAMNAASESSDIDLLIITKHNTLWITRLKTLMALRRQKIATRKPRSKLQKDRLCLNIWMDECDLAIDNKNAYTAHELAQIVPVIDRQNTHKKLLARNPWVTDYWPSAVTDPSSSLKDDNLKFNLAKYFIEKLAYLCQRIYMARKITHEVVMPSRAFFHPHDWSQKIVKELAKRGVVEA